jgi:voltage-gated potassium channel
MAHLKHAVTDFLKNYRSQLLTLAFIAQMLASPLADRHALVGGVLAFALMLVVLAAATFVANRKIVRVAIIPLVGVWLIARLLEALGDSSRFYTHLSPIVGLALSCAMLWAILDRFDHTPTITSSVIAEAFTSYLVIAIAFSQLFWILARIVANPFNQVIPSSQSSTYLYFSMITLSGVGYGGILPVDPYVRLIAALENMIGIFYVAVVVARLVSAYRPPDRGDTRNAA